jgi:hypothetical protein
VPIKIQLEKGVFRLIFFTIALQIASAPANAESIVCQPETWFDSDNQKGFANFTFSFDFVEREGVLSYFQPNGFNCTQFTSVQFNSSEIYLLCHREALLSNESWGRFEVITNIDRNNGYMTQMQAFENTQKYTIYEGYCGITQQKF